jgi:hypothetical protein
MQIGLSPKLVAAALTSIVTFAVTKLGLSWDPIFEQAINAIAPIIAAYLAPPGAVAGVAPQGENGNPSLPEGT